MFLSQTAYYYLQEMVVAMVILATVLGSCGPVMGRQRRTVLFSGWQPHLSPPDHFYYPRTENYYHKMKPGRFTKKKSQFASNRHINKMFVIYDALCDFENYINFDICAQKLSLK